MMKRMILSGCNGKMGQMIASCARDRDDCMIVAGIDPGGSANDVFPVFSTPVQCGVQADVIIDFSHPSALIPLLEYAGQTGLPVVVATTGLSSDQQRLIAEAAKTLPVFWSANMSMGVNLLAEMAKKAAVALGGQFDIEIIEKHHNQKLDAPSGTALMLADEISSALPSPPQYVYDRHAVRKKRDKKEIGIHAVRGGTIVGEHEVIFAGRDEVITLSHVAASKEVFAVGSLSAALFLCGKPAGLYNMRNLVTGIQR